MDSELSESLITSFCELFFLPHDPNEHQQHLSSLEAQTHSYLWTKSNPVPNGSHYGVFNSSYTHNVISSLCIIAIVIIIIIIIVIIIIIIIVIMIPAINSLNVRQQLINKELEYFIAK